MSGTFITWVPLPERVFNSRLEAALLFLLANLQPILDEDDPAIHDIFFNRGTDLQESACHHRWILSCDLLYRLNVFPIEMPSLRERRADIPLLVEYFIDRYARKSHKKRVNKKTLELLQSYPWPGNIRELQNVIERSMILCETEIFSIDESWLPQQRQVAGEPTPQVELPRRLLVQEKNMIEAALKETGGRVSGPKGVAVKPGIARSTLESKILSLEINKNRFRSVPET